MIRIILVILIVCLHAACNEKRNEIAYHEAQDVGKDTCDDPDANVSCCFDNMPEILSPVMKITGREIPGIPLIIQGNVLRNNKPVPGTLIYAYHTDNEGYYSKSGTESGIRKWHGRLHGWCKSDASGSFEIHTIRPSPYPNSQIPAHIHLAVKVNDRNEPFYITDIVFADDPFLGGYREPGLQGGTGIVTLKRHNGVWEGERNIILTN